MPQSYTQSGRRLGFAVLFFVLCTILIVTLEPLQFRIPRRVHLMWWDGWFDVIANVGLFMIPGFLFGLARQATTGTESPTERRAATLKLAFIYGAIVSSTIELIQTFEPARYPSPTDVLSNTTGMWLGTWTFLRISRLLGSDTPLIGMFALEMPLMGLVYLLAPLCMLTSLTLPHAAAASGVLGMAPRAYGLLALASFIGVLLGHVQRNRFGPKGLVSARQTAAAAAGAFAVGALPALPANPLLVAMGASFAASIAWCFGTLFIRPPRSANRRFEGTALRRAAPFFIGYLVLASIATTAASSRVSKVQLISQVESYAAFTVFGFLLAEGWGRLELRYRWVVAYVGTVSLATAYVLRMVGQPSPFTVWVAVSLVTHAIAGAYGGWIYHLQRAHVRSLVAAQRAATPAESRYTGEGFSSAA
ncbi:MAG: VanZ family protein [bacterium]